MWRTRAYTEHHVYAVSSACDPAFVLVCDRCAALMHMYAHGWRLMNRSRWDINTMNTPLAFVCINPNTRIAAGTRIFLFVIFISVPNCSHFFAKYILIWREKFSPVIFEDQAKKNSLSFSQMASLDGAHDDSTAHTIWAFLWWWNISRSSDSRTHTHTYRDLARISSSQRKRGFLSGHFH